MGEEVGRLRGGLATEEALVDLLKDLLVINFVDLLEQSQLHLLESP